MAQEEPGRCPHSRLLGLQFRGCDRFDPITFEPVDLDGRPLAVHVTCRHLATGGPDGPTGPWYPQCALGGPPDFPLLQRPAAGPVSDAEFVENTISMLLRDAPDVTPEQLTDLHRIRRLSADPPE